MSFEARPRVIVHIDLDAFYCQVEQKRHGIPRDTPCAVQQWEGLIAVNYAARAAGVTRHMRVGEARKICPQLQTVHVETIGEGGASSPGRSQAGLGARGGGGAARRNEAKASLQPYRQASSEIMRILASQLGPGCLLEKASVDEAFLDVTPMAEEELRRLENDVAPAAGAGGGAEASGEPGASFGQQPQATTAGATAVADAVVASGLDAGCGDDVGGVDVRGAGLEGFGGDGDGDGDGGGDGGGGSGGLSAGLLAAARRVCEASVVVGGPPQLMNEVDRRLVVGGLIALRLRQAVRSQLDFTCSAGVATNKLMAKVGSARNKPDKQTLVLPRGVHDLMQDMPLGKLRGLGGKLGATLEQHFGATTAGQVQQLPLEQLQRQLGERTGLWVTQVVRGQCSEPVTPKDKPKSLLSCKSFEATREGAELARWLTILAEELVQRCGEDEAANRRRARTLVLHYRGTGPRERSVRCAMPQHGREGASVAAIAKACMEMLRRQPDALPCSRLAIAATEFDDPPAPGSRAISRFFQAQPKAGEQGQGQLGRSAGHSLGAVQGRGQQHHEQQGERGFMEQRIRLPERELVTHTYAAGSSAFGNGDDDDWTGEEGEEYVGVEELADEGAGGGSAATVAASAAVDQARRLHPDWRHEGQQPKRQRLELQAQQHQHQQQQQQRQQQQQPQEHFCVDSGGGGAAAVVQRHLQSQGAPPAPLAAAVNAGGRTEGSVVAHQHELSSEGVGGGAPHEPLPPSLAWWLEAGSAVEGEAVVQHQQQQQQQPHQQRQQHIGSHPAAAPPPPGHPRPGAIQLAGVEVTRPAAGGADGCWVVVVGDVQRAPVWSRGVATREREGVAGPPRPGWVDHSDHSGQHHSGPGAAAGEGEGEGDPGGGRQPRPERAPHRPFDSLQGDSAGGGGVGEQAAEAPGRGPGENLGRGGPLEGPPGGAVAAPPEPHSPGLLEDVDVEEQRRILHEIELARLRSLGRSGGAVAGGGRSGGTGRAGAGGGGGGSGGRGRGRGGAAVQGRASSSHPGAAGKERGQMRLTALLQPQHRQQSNPP